MKYLLGGLIGGTLSYYGLSYNTKGFWVIIILVGFFGASCHD